MRSPPISAAGAGPVSQRAWVVSSKLLYGQMVKRRNKRKDDGLSFIITRMKIGKRINLIQRLRLLGLSDTIQTAIIERFNLTIRHGVAALARRTWSKARSNETLYLHVQWWRGYYHLSRVHESLRVRVPGLKRKYRQRTPAIAAGHHRPYLVSRRHPPQARSA